MKAYKFCPLYDVGHRSREKGHGTQVLGGEGACWGQCMKKDVMPLLPVLAVAERLWRYAHRMNTARVTYVSPHE